MALRNDWPVADEGIRPAGKPDECLYCKQKKGLQHASGCVIRQRTVNVRISFDVVMTVSEDADRDLIEFTEGSACSERFVDIIVEANKRLKAAGECMCGRVEVEYLGEASPEDEAEANTRITDVRS